MSLPATPTLDQLRVLVAVVDEGSFSAAARRLNRSQSVVSYGIANLEGQLGLEIFERGRRRPTLTRAGGAMLEEARRMLSLMDDLRARAAGLRTGLEAELSLAVDVMFPTYQLVCLLHAFAAAYPTVSLRLRIEALGAVSQLVLDGVCTLGIASWMSLRFEALNRREICSVELVPVAAPEHPLAALPGPLSATALRDHTQLVLTDRSNVTQGQDFGVVSPRTWRLGDLGAKHALLLAGLGWGNMPAHAVAGDLAAGRLVRLPVHEGESRPYPLIIIHRNDTPPGPAARWLVAQIASDAPLPPGNAAPTLDPLRRPRPTVEKISGEMG
jgi:DNA-binding transcriptional LysR family regulator